MKKFYIPYIVFSIIFITMFVINTKLPNTNNKKNTDNITKSPIINTEETPVIPETKEVYYIARMSGNLIYLYDNDNNKINKLDIDYANLRQYDKNQFIKGIKIKTMHEVYQLVEDFSN